MINLKNVEQSFKDGENIKEVLKDVSFTINDGEFVALYGKSGSGKSTLLNIIGGLRKPKKGNVVFDGLDITTLSNDQNAEFRRHNIGFIYQDLNLLSVLNVRDNLLLQAEMCGIKISNQDFNDLITTLEIEDKLDSITENLSGGERQRVAIGRAVLTRPQLILADEPTGSLDTKTGDNIMNLLKNIQSKYGCSILMITHDESLTKYVDRVLYLKENSVYE